MKIILILSVVLDVVFGSAPADNFAATKDLPTHLNDPLQLINGFFETPLDHFSPLEPRRLRFSYQSNVEFLEDGGPIFVNLNNGHGSRWLTTGLVHDLARELGGAVVTADVRFQSKNWVTNTTIEILHFFTMEQIAGDVAHLITKVKQDYDSPISRVIVFGNFLGGTAAILARKWYPHLIDGAWSSGGLFRAAVPDNYFFDAFSWNIYHHGSNHCAIALSTAFRNMVNLVEQRNTTRLNQLFNLCDNIDFSNPQEATNFYREIFRMVDNYINLQNYGGIRNICNDINHSSDPLRAFARWANFVYDTDGECRDLSYNTALKKLRNEQDRTGYRTFNFFYCTQFGLNFLVTKDNPPGGVFPNVINEAFYETRCRDAFGDVFNRTLLERAVDDFNIQHGAQNQVVSNAIFTHGGLDPFLAHGAVNIRGESSGSIMTPLHSRVADMSSISDYDSAYLLATKQAVLEALRGYVDGMSSSVDPGNER